MTNQNGQCVICKTGVRRVRLFPGNRSAKSLPPTSEKKRINQLYVIRFYQGEDIFSHWSIANKTSPFMGPPTFHPALKQATPGSYGSDEGMSDVQGAPVTRLLRRFHDKKQIVRLLCLLQCLVCVNDLFILCIL